MVKRKIKAKSLEQPPTKRVSLRNTTRTRNEIFRTLPTATTNTQEVAGPRTPGCPEGTSTAKGKNPSSYPPTLHPTARHRDTSPPIVTVHATENGVQLIDHCLPVTERHPNSSSHLPLPALSNHAEVSTTRSPPRKKRGRPPRRVAPDPANHVVSSPLPEHRGARQAPPQPTETNPARHRDTHQESLAPDADPDLSQPVCLHGESQALPPPVEIDPAPPLAACQTSLAPDAVAALSPSAFRQIERQRPLAAEAELDLPPSTHRSIARQATLISGTNIAHLSLQHHADTPSLTVHRRGARRARLPAVEEDADYSPGSCRGARQTRPPAVEEGADYSPGSRRGARRKRPLPVEEKGDYSPVLRRDARRARPPPVEEDDDSSPASRRGARRARPPPIEEDDGSSPASRRGALRTRPPLVEDGVDSYDSSSASCHRARRTRPPLVEEEADSYNSSPVSRRGARQTRPPLVEDGADSSPALRPGVIRARSPPTEDEFNYPPASRHAVRRARPSLVEDDADSSPASRRGARRARPPPVENELNSSPASRSRARRVQRPQIQNFDNHDNVADVNYNQRLDTNYNARSEINYPNNYKVDDDESGDAITRLANILGNTMKNLQRSSIENSYSYSTRISEKKLPTFDGDPLDWIHFRQTFESSSRLGRYSDKENVSRLFDALKG